MVVIGSQPMTLDGTYLLEGSVGITLASAPGKTGVLKNVALPNRLQVKRYNGPDGTINSDGGPNGTLSWFSIDRVKEVKMTGADGEDETE